MSDQFDLLDYQPPNYRHDNPQTSKDAGKRARTFAGAHHKAIVDVLAIGRPMAAEEIADATTGLDHVKVGKRMAALARAGLIVATEELHKNRSGSRARRYRLVVQS